MNPKNFFRPMLGIFAFFLFTFIASGASPTDPTKTDPGKIKTDRLTATSSELGNKVRTLAFFNKPGTYTVDEATQTYTCFVPKMLLFNNDLVSSAEVTFSNQNASTPVSVKIATQSRDGQQELWIFPSNPEKTEVRGPGVYNDSNADQLLDHANTYLDRLLQSGNSSLNDQPSDVNNNSSNGIVPAQQPQKTARSGSKTSQR